MIYDEEGKRLPRARLFGLPLFKIVIHDLRVGLRGIARFEVTLGDPDAAFGWSSYTEM